MGRFIPSVAGTLVVFVVGCSGSDSAQSQPQSKDAGADSSADGSTGGSGGNGNTGGTGGTSGSGGIGGGGASGGIGGASGSAGASGGGGASGSAGASGGGGASGSAGASGGGGASGSSGAGGSAGAAGASGSDAGVDAGNDAQASCGLGQACCSGSTCTGGYNCLGQTCSCILAIHGNTVLRTNGTVVSYGGPATVIEQGSTGQPLSGITEIYEGSHYGCGLKNDHTVWCWPKNTNANAAGELGNGTQTAPQNADLFKATQVLVAAGTPLSGVDHISKGSARCYLASNTCGVKSDGTLWCWGSHDSSGGGGGSLFNGGISGPQSFRRISRPPRAWMR